MPNLLNSEPTPAAPIVCEIVLSVSIAASGTSMSSFNSLSLLPLFRSSLLYISMWDQVTDRMIASKSEHKKDTPNAKIRNIVILPHSSSGLPKSSPTFETIDKKSNKLITTSK